MSETIRENKFIKITLIQVEHKEIDRDKVLAEVNDYLLNNSIENYNYKCTGFGEFNKLRVEINLIRDGVDLYNEGQIDEDFDSDENWKAFCKKMEVLLEVRSFSVPYWYYSK
jgi:hypothetical protein